jgi:hypothetical protein
MVTKQKMNTPQNTNITDGIRKRQLNWRKPVHRSQKMTQEHSKMQNKSVPK